MSSSLFKFAQLIVPYPVDKPFPYEKELATKSARLVELNALLDMDRQENEIMDGEQGSKESHRRRSTT